MTDLADDVLEAFGLADARDELLVEYGLGGFGTSKRAENERRRQQVVNAVLREEIRRLSRAFDEVPFVLLKGEPLDELLFDGRGRRSTGDIDLLVVSGDLDVIRRRLTDVGYRRKRGEAPRRWAHNQEPWVHAHHGLVVELHWSLAVPGVPAPSPSRLVESRRSFVVGDDLVVDVLRDDWLGIQLALHFHHHTGFAKGLVDIAAWCDRFAARIDADEYLARLRRLGLFGIFQWPLHTIERLIGRRPPLWRPDVDAAIRGFARGSAAAMEGCLIERTPTDLEASLVGVMSRFGPVRSLLIDGLSMLAADGWTNKLRGAVGRTVAGPHSVGRGVEAVRSWFRR